MTKILCLTDGVKKKDNDIGHSPLCQNEQLNCSFIKNDPIPLPCGMKLYLQNQDSSCEINHHATNLIRQSQLLEIFGFNKKNKAWKETF